MDHHMANYDGNPRRWASADNSLGHLHPGGQWLFTGGPTLKCWPHTTTIQRGLSMANKDATFEGGQSPFPMIASLGRATLLPGVKPISTV